MRDHRLPGAAPAAALPTPHPAPARPSCLPLLLQAVWAVLTDYNRLAEFVPNLAVSQRIALPPGAPPNVIRVRQVRRARGEG